MDDPSNSKSSGLKFAEQQMQRHGWTEGKGLGKREDGISEAIKVKVKCDTAGVGHNSAEQFTFHWWDHVFNKTASSISVDPDQDGVKVKKVSEDDGTVSSKKPRKAMLSSNMLYGRFIKSATLMSGGEQPVEEASSSPDTSDSSEDEDSKLDLSSATKLSDEDLVRICGGRTAHKGARHGLTMNAKLSRIEEQERAFMEKYGKKETKQQPCKSTEEINGYDGKRKKKKKQREGNVDDEENDNLSNTEVPKKKTKHKKEDGEESVEVVANSHDQEQVPSMEEGTVTLKKKKKQKKGDGEESVEVVANGHDQEQVPSMEEDTMTLKKKKKQKKGDGKESVEVVASGQEHVPSMEENTMTLKKKKKKQKKGDGKESVEAVANSHNQEHVLSTEGDTMTLKKKRSKVPQTDEDHRDDLSVEERETRPAKKKKKTVEQEEAIFSGHGEDSVQSIDDGDSRPELEDKKYGNTEEETRKSKKKKKKSKRTEYHKELVNAEEHTVCSEEELSRKPKSEKLKVDEENGEENYLSEGRLKRKKRKIVDNEDQSKEEDTKAKKKKKKSKGKD